MKKILALIFLSAVTVGNASALELNVLGGLNYSNLSTSGPGYAGVSLKSTGAVTFGATLQFNMMPALALEVGAFSNGNKQTATVPGISFDRSSRSLEIPLLVKFTGLPFFDVGAGVYYEKSPTTFDVTNSTDISSVPNGVNTVDQNTNSISDYGLKFNARLKIPLAPLFHALLDASYKIGIKDTDKSAADSSKASTYALLAGASVGF